jgi:hypothetical protein
LELLLKINDEPELYYNGVGSYAIRNWGIGNIDKFMTKFVREISCSGVSNKLN